MKLLFFPHSKSWLKFCKFNVRAISRCFSSDLIIFSSLSPFSLPYASPFFKSVTLIIFFARSGRSLQIARWARLGQLALYRFFSCRLSASFVAGTHAEVSSWRVLKAQPVLPGWKRQRQVGRKVPVGHTRSTFMVGRQALPSPNCLCGALLTPGGSGPQPAAASWKGFFRHCNVVRSATKPCFCVCVCVCVCDPFYLHIAHIALFKCPDTLCS